MRGTKIAGIFFRAFRRWSHRGTWNVEEVLGRVIEKAREWSGVDPRRRLSKRFVERMGKLDCY